MQNFNITYNRSSSRILTSKIWRKVSRGVILPLLKLSWMVGIAAYLVVITAFFIDSKQFVGLIIAFKAIGALGVVSFIYYVFFRTYFRQVEQKSMEMPESGSIDIYEISDLELVDIIDKKPGDLSELISRLVLSPRVRFMLNEMNVDIMQLSTRLSPVLSAGTTEVLNQVFSVAIENAIQEQEVKITTADVMLGFLSLMPDKESFYASIELNDKDIESICFWANSLFNRIKFPISLMEKLKRSTVGLGEDWAYGYTLYLDRYGYSISTPGYADSSYVVGRKDKLEKIEDTMSRNAGNNCLLVGVPGCGKKTLVYAFAAKLFSGTASKTIAHYRVVQLDIEALMAGASGPHDVLERLEYVFNDAAHAGNVIIFIENIHILFEGDNRIGTVDASEVLNSYLNSGSVRVIATTTQRDYDSYISPKTATSGVFEVINIEETNREDTIKILEDMSIGIASRYKIGITYSALKEIYRISDEFVSDVAFPRKAINLLEKTMSKVQQTGGSVLDNQVVASICQDILSIPIAGMSSMEKDVLMGLEETMHKRVISQDEAVTDVVNALKRKKAQVSHSKRPIGVFLFLGPTGVGKTEVAKTLAASYFGDESSIIRIDMNQFQDANSLKRLLGEKRPGLEELEGGQLVKAVKQKPFSVVLLDELEKASKDVLNLFLQIFDEGYAVDGMGTNISFTNTIIIATSNAEANMVKEGVSGNVSWTVLKENVVESLQQDAIFTPEFINRFDDLVLFKPLNEQDIRQVAKNLIGLLVEDFSRKGYLLEIDNDVLDILVEKGYHPEFGARPMKRAIQDILENFLANKIISNELIKGQKFVVNKAVL